jgi:hypothetical protein
MKYFSVVYSAILRTVMPVSSGDFWGGVFGLYGRVARWSRGRTRAAVASALLRASFCDEPPNPGS